MVKIYKNQVVFTIMILLYSSLEFYNLVVNERIYLKSLKHWNVLIFLTKFLYPYQAQDHGLQMYDVDNDNYSA